MGVENSRLYEAVADRLSAVSDVFRGSVMNEIAIAEDMRIDEGFVVLANALDRLRECGVEFLVNGAVNLSRLAYALNITTVYPEDNDYVFERFCNSYKNNALPNNIAVAIDVASDNIELTRKILSDTFCDANTVHTVSVVSVDGSFADESVRGAYAGAAEAGSAVLDVMLHVSEQTAAFGELKKRVAPHSIVDLDRKTLYEHMCIKSFPEIFGDKADIYRQILMRLQADGIDDVIFAVALAEAYGENYHDIDFLFGEPHYRKEIADCLKDSRGIIMYQEQAMKILHALSGCSYEYADIVRSAICKGNRRACEKYAHEFLHGAIDLDGKAFDGCIKRGTEIAGRNIWAELNEKMGGLVLKAHYSARAKFYVDCAVLNMFDK